MKALLKRHIKLKCIHMLISFFFLTYRRILSITAYWRILCWSDGILSVICWVKNYDNLRTNQKIPYKIWIQPIRSGPLDRMLHPGYFQYWTWDHGSYCSACSTNSRYIPPPCWCARTRSGQRRGIFVIWRILPDCRVLPDGSRWPYATTGSDAFRFLTSIKDELSWSIYCI